MWNGPPPTGAYGNQPGAAAAAAAAGQRSNQSQKHDIFVGNLAFSTTEEQLHQAFSEIGRVIKVRLVTDLETGKPRGFAFIEFEDPQAALSAIRNMNDYEINGRRIRVNFSNSSHLEALAGKLGMDLTQQTQRPQSSQQPSNQPGPGTSAVAESLKSMSKGEMYDVVAKMKEIADRDPEEARRLLSGHPQLPEAMLFLMSRLDMVQTPVSSEGGMSVLPPPGGIGDTSVPPPRPVTRVADPRARANDPRANLSDPRNAAASSPAAPPPPQRADPRARVDPRAARSAPQPPSRPSQYAVPPPPPSMGVPPPPPAGLPNVDPGLAQQVMSLTPQQISLLPQADQQNILALREQIARSGR